MEMKLIFSLIETGALPASFLGITNLSFLFYSPPRCKSKVSRNVLPERTRFGFEPIRLFRIFDIGKYLLGHRQLRRKSRKGEGGGIPEQNFIQQQNTKPMK